MADNPRQNLRATLVEELASIEHRRWAHWQQYLHSKAVKQADGSLLIPTELVERWERQINTQFADLPDEEKASDREQVERYLPLIEQALKKNGR